MHTDMYPNAYTNLKRSIVEMLITQVCDDIGIDAYDLSVDTLDMHCVSVSRHGACSCCDVTCTNNECCGGRVCYFTDCLYYPCCDVIILFPIHTSVD